MSIWFPTSGPTQYGVTGQQREEISAVKPPVSTATLAQPVCNRVFSFYAFLYIFIFTFEDFCSHCDRIAWQICPVLVFSSADSSCEERQKWACGARGGPSKRHQGWGPRDKKRSQGRRCPYGAEPWSLFPTGLGDTSTDRCSDTKATGEIFVLMS